jgi:predicted Kef-type K+ transport protein
MEGNDALMMSTVLIWIAGAWGAGQIARWAALPPLVGYLTAGALFAANGLGDSQHWLEIPSEIGVELLLFAVGLKMNPRSIFRFDVAFGTLLHLMLSACILALALTQDLSIEMKIALALTLGFSSTVVAAKGLEARREIRAFHGRLSISILVLQDLVAVTLLAVGGDSAPSPFALGLLAIPLVAPLLRKGLEKLSPEPELHLLVGVLLALVLGAQLFKAVGVSGELGALVMGMVFANHPVAKGIANYLWGVRELLLIAFFLRVGMQVPLDLQIVMDALPLLLLLPLKLAVLFALLVLIRLRAYTAF